MKKILFIIAFAAGLSASAQVKQVTLQASGLTCSMCSKAIFKSLEKLAITDSITSNIRESSYTLTFKQAAAVDFDAILKAVEGAGFSVIKMQVKADFDHIAIQNDAHISLTGEVFHFLDVKPQTLTGEQTFQIVDRNFVSEKVFRKYAATTQMECVKTGKMKACCNKETGIGNRIYHITV